MSLRFPRMVVLVGLLALAAPPVYADDDDDDDDNRRRGYQEQVERRRRAAAERYERWREENEKRRRTWRESPVREGDRILELPESGLEPGQYTVRLPFGLGGVRIDVRDSGPRPSPGPGWNDRSYADVHYRSRQLSSQLRELYGRLDRAGHRDATAAVGGLLEACDRLVAASAGRGSPADVRARYVEFDQQWHPFYHQYGAMAELGPAIQSRLRTIDEYEDGLHQILAIAPAPPYDRPVVAALTSELVQATSHLLDDLQVEARQSIGFNVVARRADRVRRHAADLHETVQQNAAFATIVDEFLEFDRSWHRFLDEARGDPAVDGHLRRVARQVRAIDEQLHRELYVNSPTIGGRQRLIRLSESIARSADHLYGDLEADLGGRDRELLLRSRNVAAVARDFHASLQDGDPAAREQLYAGLITQWGELAASINRELRGERFEHTRMMAGQLQGDIDRFAELWSESKRGRAF